MRRIAVAADRKKPRRRPSPADQLQTVQLRQPEVFFEAVSFVVPGWERSRVLGQYPGQRDLRMAGFFGRGYFANTIHYDLVSPAVFFRKRGHDIAEIIRVQIGSDD